MLSSKRDFLKGMAASGLVLGVTNHSWAQSLCSVWDKTVLWDLRSALWGRAGENTTSVYLIGAPWCPFSRQAVKDYLAGRLPFELRFIPIDAVQVRHRAQQADIVLNNLVGLERTFLDKDAKPPMIDPSLQKLIHDANFIALNGFQKRLANIASPTFIYETSRGGASLVGHEPWAKFTTDLKPLGDEPTDFSTQLDTILAETKKLNQVAEMKTMYRTAIHSLPDTGSSSAGCVSHTTFKAVAELHYRDVDWVQVHALTSNEKEAIFGYVDRRDVAFV